MTIALEFVVHISDTVELSRIDMKVLSQETRRFTYSYYSGIISSENYPDILKIRRCPKIDDHGNSFEFMYDNIPVIFLRGNEADKDYYTPSIRIKSDEVKSWLFRIEALISDYNNDPLTIEKISYTVEYGQS